ncbi:DsbA family protein [Neptunomonas sp.]|uniref:DsbA family protein n=1 Tax=Neptunomonas sp. TaxID=1971898 RepID=UPI00356788C3
MKKLLYIMDPMCSWCWAFSPTAEAIKQTFPNLAVEFIMGGLAADSDSPMPKEQQKTIRSIWQHIEESTGTKFNYDFWTQCSPRRSTWRACRAVIVAEQLSPGSAAQMANAIQQAYYLNAQNPSDSETLIRLAESLGINASDFAPLIDAQSTQQTLQEHMALSRQLNVSGFPALRFLDGEKVIRLSDGYSKPDRIIKELHQLGANE